MIFIFVAVSTAGQSWLGSNASSAVLVIKSGPSIERQYIHCTIYSTTVTTLIYSPVKMPKGSGLTKPMKLSPELASLIGAKKEEKLSRPEVVKRLWAYIKEKKLQDPQNKQFFVPDKTMEPIFGKERIRAFGMAKYLKTHLTA